jgi:uncharacterized protein
VTALFEWDDAKAASNFAKHGLAFNEAIRLFNDPEHVVVATFRELDNESRFKAIGRIGARLYTVVFTRRGELKRIISARRSNAPEEKLYGDRPLCP